MAASYVPPVSTAQADPLRPRSRGIARWLMNEKLLEPDRHPARKGILAGVTPPRLPASHEHMVRVGPPVVASPESPRPADRVKGEDLPSRTVNAALALQRCRGITSIPTRSPNATLSSPTWPPVRAMTRPGSSWELHSAFYDNLDEDEFYAPRWFAAPAAWSFVLHVRRVLWGSCWNRPPGEPDGGTALPGEASESPAMTEKALPREPLRRPGHSSGLARLIIRFVGGRPQRGHLDPMRQALSARLLRA